MDGKLKDRLLGKGWKAMILAWNLLVRGGGLSVVAGMKVWKGLIGPLMEYGAEVR